ncbi:PREDICTED: uncharacterized protein LOC108661544 [Theobroma cacao]|uniref:Uncharacterized protein LOC108661544 n=1 Tax=Theobroma cacao TaxID=3641 RepID=A0AB32WA06_THECC|nr:PREDICTED: uncharacterized protein LOC108661544 [Theobroma cacao]
MEVFKKLHINIPFVEVLEPMPSYVKFLKDILSKKRRLGELEIIAFIEECSVIIQNKLPPKLKDPGSFTIPCTIGALFFSKALSDLGVSINLMLFFIYNKLGLGEIKPIIVTLQLAYKTLTYSRAIMENVLVKVDKFKFPVDFIALDMEKDRKIPIIFGRPFLRTTKAHINVEKRELTLRVQDQMVTFNIFQPLKFTIDHDKCFAFTVVDKDTNEMFMESHSTYPLEASLLAKFETNNQDVIERVNALNALSCVLGTEFELLDLSISSFSPMKTSN